MINLTNKQKILIGMGVIVAILVIIYYFYQNFQEVNYETDDVSIKENNIKTEEVEEGEILIHITGAVKKEGVVHLKEGARVIDAIDESGGLLEDANLSKVNLAYPLSDGQKLYIPHIRDEETEVILSTSGEETIKGEESNLSENKVNINNATQTELETLPGIGASIAYSIIEYRKENGNFKQIEDVKNVSGIGDAKYNQIKEFICVK